MLLIRHMAGKLTGKRFHNSWLTITIGQFCQIWAEGQLPPLLRRETGVYRNGSLQWRFEFLIWSGSSTNHCFFPIFPELITIFAKNAPKDLQFSDGTSSQAVGLTNPQATRLVWHDGKSSEERKTHVKSMTKSLGSNPTGNVIRRLFTSSMNVKRNPVICSWPSCKPLRWNLGLGLGFLVCKSQIKRD